MSEQSSKGSINIDELSKALDALNVGKSEQANLERALGMGFLQKLSGNRADLVENYRNAGGNDPIIRHVLTNMNEKFNELDLAAGTEQLSAVINSDLTIGMAKRAAKKKVAIMNQSSIPGQAAETFARFANKNSLDRISDSKEE